MYFLYDSNTFVYDKVEPTPGQMPTKDNRPSTNDIVLMEAINKHRTTLNLPTIPPNDDAWLVAVYIVNIFQTICLFGMSVC